MVKHEWFYIKHLQKYFNEHYKEYEDTAEWYGNPKPNQWKCRISELSILLYLTCDDEGNVTEYQVELPEEW